MKTMHFSSLFLLFLALSLSPTSAANVTVTSSPSGFLNIDSPGYQYGATISLVGDNYVAMWCSPGQNGAWDVIRMSTSPDLVSWSPSSIIFAPQTAYDTTSVCDPSLVKFNNQFLLYHTCLNVNNPPDGYTNNRICVAIADNVLGPYYAASLPVVQDLSCPADVNAAYCVGQPSAIVDPVNGGVLLYYTNQLPSDTTGPNPGQIYVQHAQDGIHFSPLNKGYPIFPQRDVDVKYDRTNKVYLMVQGDVGSPTLTYATSSDGITFSSYDASGATIATNPGLPPGGSNNNPGLVGMPDGSFSGMIGVTYGSSNTNPPTWGGWKLYLSNMVVNPPSSNCSSCVQNSCDFGCRTDIGSQAGYCNAPGSTDSTNCCACTAFAGEAGCGACAPSGCVETCRGAGFQTGTCGVPGGSDPTHCCTCYA